MRVGVVTTSYPRSADDYAGRFVADLCSAWAIAGDRIEVLAPAPAISESSGVRVIPIGLRRDRPWRLLAAGAPDALWGEGSLWARGQAWADVPSLVARLALATSRHGRSWDAIVSHWLIPSGILSARVGRRLPHLAVAHGSDVYRLARLPGRGLILRQLSRAPSRLVLTSEALRRPLLQAVWPRDRRTRRWIEEAVVQGMGIHLPPADEIATFPAPGSWRGGKPKILFLGRLVPVKGVDVLLQAVSGLARSVSLSIVGDGPLRSRLEDQAAKLQLDCCFWGTQLGSRKAALLRDADLLVMPSLILPDGRQDSAPLVLPEALAAGVPVIASRVGGAADLLDDGVTGWLVSPGDADALRLAIARALDDHTRRTAIAAAGRVLAEGYAWRHVAHRIRDLLVDLVDEPGRF
ncbi:MAG: glycosyltransferase [Deltaproteobacteria bacterium]|nr:glycosyltransferase [Deltaproteobacteria bacterium]